VSLLNKKAENAFISTTDLNKIREENSHVYINSDFNFLKCHNGLRPGQMHILIGTSGSGKSTVVRKIILDSAKKHKVLLWLSEESREDFITALSKNFPQPETARNIKIVSEFDVCKDHNVNHEQVFSEYEKHVKSINPSVVFFDNITTSRMYMGLRPSDQEAMAWKLKGLQNSIDTPVFIVAHTRADVTDTNARIIEDADIRGSKSITNLAQYIYIYQRFHIADYYYPTIRIRKSRGYQVKQNMFLLTYSRDKNAYVCDKEVSFKEFKEAYEKRNKL